MPRPAPRLIRVLFSFLQSLLAGGRLVVSPWRLEATGPLAILVALAVLCLLLTRR
jgi:hypothetical protein